MNLKLCQKQFTVINCYAPNDELEQQNWLNNSNTLIKNKALNINNLTVCGDFNCCKSMTDQQQHNEKTKVGYLSIN